MKRSNLKKVDYTFLTLIIVFLILGLAMLYSASTVESYQNFGNTSHFFVHQLIYGVLIGTIAMYLFSKIDYHFWKKIIPFLVGGSLILLIFVKIPGIGFTFGGASRWIKFGPLFFQPAELAKFSAIFYLAGWISSRGQQIKNFYYGILPAISIIGLFALLILWQPDVGTMSILVITSLAMFFLGGIQVKQLFTIIGLGAIASFILIKLEPYRAQRLSTFLNPKIDPLGIGYQINQALLAIGGGGFWGYGYGFSRQKYNYLPQAFGDSIFAIMAEELGFIRIVLILGLFLVFAIRGIKIGLKAPDSFGKILAIGVISAIMTQVIINIAAITGLLPLTGIPLPFFSYGSSALIVLMAELGIMLNISRQAAL